MKERLKMLKALKQILFVLALLTACPAVSSAAQDLPACRTISNSTASCAGQEVTAGTETWKNRNFTAAELKKYNGKKGRPVYVAVNGIVYDLSTAPPWKTGLHKMMHTAGRDLTEAFMKRAPKFHRDKMVLNKYPKAGILVK